MSTPKGPTDLTTRDFIKMILEADPTGDAHVSLSGGAPYSATRMPGYWDGSYSYLDEGIYVRSRAGYKVTIQTTSLIDVIWDAEGDMALIKTHIRLTSADDSHFWEGIEKSAAECRGYFQQNNAEWIRKLVKMVEEREICYFEFCKGSSRCHAYNSEGECVADPLCSGEIQALINSPGLFECYEDTASISQWKYTKGSTD